MLHFFRRKSIGPWQAESSFMAVDFFCRISIWSQFFIYLFIFNFEYPQRSGWKFINNSSKGKTQLRKRLLNLLESTKKCNCGPTRPLRPLRPLKALTVDCWGFSFYFFTSCQSTKTWWSRFNQLINISNLLTFRLKLQVIQDDTDLTKHKNASNQPI